MIGIRPQAGLANRMRSLDSAIKMAEDYKKELIIYWIRTPDFNCSFSKLFKDPGTYKLIEGSSRLRDNGRAQYLLQELLLSNIGIRYPQGYKRYIYHREMVDMKLNRDVNEVFSKGEPVFIQTDTRFYKPESNYSFFKPSDEIEDKVGNFLNKNLNANYIGIHIRRSDNIQSILNSPTELFIKYMKEESEKNPEVLFYLATDSPDEEKYLKTIFPNRIITRDKQLSRNNPLAIQDAWIDLLILSRASRIFGSFYSSFSETAAAIGNVAFLQVKKSVS
ncbi:MAG: hypothetical protein HC830_04440 [Bacteroidetes bacterium]|nr:hypothetical protein [Bacteroidota bacterium]